MKVENIHSRQNFGMAIKIFDPQSAVALKSALKSSGDTAKFVEQIKAQKNNEFNIGLRYVYVFNIKKLRGCIYDGRSFYREYTENSFSAKFLSPIKFIQKMCEEANKLHREREAKSTISGLLNYKV